MDKTNARTVVRLLIAAALSVAGLALAVRNASVSGVRAAFEGASLLWLLPYPFICVVLNVLRGEIWRRLLDRRVRRTAAFWAYCVGFLANNVLPFRIGEAVRVVVLSRRTQVPIVDVAAGAALERLLDMMALALMLAVITPMLGPMPGLGGTALVVGLGVAAAISAVVAVVRFADASSAVVERATGWLPSGLRRQVVDRWRDIVRGLSVLVRPSIGFPCAAAAIVVWVLTVVLQWLVLRSFQPRAGLLDAAFMVAVVSLAIALPAGPGFVGVYHLAGQQALVSAFPNLYTPSSALAAAFAAHAVSYITSSALGVGGLWYFGMPASALARAARQRGDAVRLDSPTQVEA